MRKIQSRILLPTPPFSFAIQTQRMIRNPALSWHSSTTYKPHDLSQFSKTQSKSSPFSNSQYPQIQLRFPEQPTHLHCSHTHIVKCGELNHCSNGLKFVRGRKLLSELSTWGIGGPCNYFVEVSSQTQLVYVVRYCQEHCIRFMIVGKGSNCLFDDMGFDGCVILNRIEFLERIDSKTFRVGSGFGFNRLGILSSSKGLTGLEFAGGIPGTVGGAAYMNAGATGQETADVVDSIEIVTTEGELQRLNRMDLKFGYRLSPFQDMEDLAAIVAVTFRLKQSESARRRQIEHLERRRNSQPLGERTAGSVFCNPSNSGLSAGEHIESAGLKGCRVGGAMVSNIHANFFINSGDSTSQDMLELISLVKERVYRKCGVQLKEEVMYVQPHCNILNPNTDKSRPL